MAGEPAVGKEPDVAPPNAGVVETVAAEPDVTSPETQTAAITTEAQAQADIATEAPSDVTQTEAAVTAETQGSPEGSPATPES